MPLFPGPLSEARIRQAGSGWYADLMQHAVTEGIAGAQRLVARATVPDMHHMTLRHTFPAGAVPDRWHAEPRVAVDLPVLDYDQQTISTHGDGSLKEAAFTILLPRMNQGDEVIIEFRPQNAPPPKEPVAIWEAYAKSATPPVDATPILAYQAPDRTRDVAAGLEPGVWRKISRNEYYDIIHPEDGGDFNPYYWYPGKTDNPLRPTNRLPFAYSSGAFLPGRGKYVFTGGGHADWLGSEVGVFDYRTQRWHRTEDSARYVVGNTGNKEEPEEDLFDPTAPVKARPHGSRYHYPWPNIRGRHAPLATHTYCGMTHAADRGRVYVYGAAGFPGGSAEPGGIWVIDDRNFQWVGAETIPTYSNGFNSWAKYLGEGRLFCFTGQHAVARLFDVTGEERTRLADRSGVRATYGTPSAAVIDDPFGGGGKAFLTWKAGKTEQFVVATNIENGGTGSFQRLDGGVPLPKGVDRQASWHYMGDDIPGSRIIAVYQPGKGLFSLDTASWQWRGPFDTPEGGDGRPPDRRAWKSFAYLPEYDCFSVVLSNGTWICKRPPEMA